MMTDQPAGERPGHLDIDAVSAFIDRDLHPADLSAIELHLTVCPACRREVLEIQATVLLLTALPQYTPRRSFCLTGQHARAARRSMVSRALPWTDSVAAHGYPAPAAGRVVPDRFGGALAGLHAMALVVGTLLLLVTSSDFLGIPPQPAAWLGQESVPVVLDQSPAPPQGAPAEAPVPRVASAPTAGVLVTATAFASEAAFARMSEEAGGTASDNRTSEGLEATEDEAPQAPPAATTSITAAVSQAQPTAAASEGRGMAGEAEEAAGVVAERPLQRSAEPSQLRLVEIALALALAWLIVTISGLRWVRRVR